MAMDSSKKCMLDLNSPPIEIFYEILSHLPVRSILRFRVVCKAWKSLIEDPFFANLHRAHSPNNLLETHFIVFAWKNINDIISDVEVKPILCNAETLTQTPSSFQAASFNKKETWSKYPSIKTGTFRPRPCPWQVVDADEDHGVILLHRRVYLKRLAITNVRKSIYRPTEVYNEIVLWNPSIDKSVVLPLIKNRCIAVLGVGHDPSSNSYKVVKICSNCSCYFRKLSGLVIDDEVCRVSSDSTDTSWRTLSRGCYINGSKKSYSYIDCFPQRNKVRFKGAMYWIRTGSNHIDLVSFDLKSEVFGSINLPDLTRDTDYNSKKIIFPAILDDGASLSIFVADTLKPSTVAIYVLEELYSSSSSSIICYKDWTKRYEIEVPAERFFFQPFQLKKNGDLIMGRDGNCYNLVSCKAKEPPCKWSLPGLNVRWFRVYKESLAFLNYV